MPHGDAAPWLQSPVTVAGVATSDLLDALCGYVIDNASVGSGAKTVALAPWSLGLADGARPNLVLGEWADLRDSSAPFLTASGATNVIATAEQLAQFAWRLNNGATFQNTVNIITNSIDLSAHRWRSAGNRDTANNFCGTLTAAPGVVVRGMTDRKSTRLNSSH